MIMNTAYDLHGQFEQLHSGPVDALVIGEKEYIKMRQLAELPEEKGVAAEVLNALVNRIGYRPLTITNIAHDMNISKRTLQRRLQKENVNFGKIRDRVRFRQSIDCLLKSHLGVEETSKYLNFSDRTSFTNAFKRWTHLSPTQFRHGYLDHFWNDPANQ